MIHRPGSVRALGHPINVKRPNAMRNTKIGIDTVAYKVTKARKVTKMLAHPCQ